LNSKGAGVLQELSIQNLMSAKLILKRLLDMLIKRGYFDYTGFDKIALNYKLKFPLVCQII